MANDPAYQAMEPDTYDVIAAYTKTTELMQVKKYGEREGKVDMCRAITELIERGRREGMECGVEQGMAQGCINAARRMLIDGKLSLEKIAEYTALPLEEVRKLRI